MTHEMFWQQLLRWLVSDTPGPGDRRPRRAPVLSDETKVTLRAEVRDKSFQARAECASWRRTSWDRTERPTSVELTPVPLEEGVYTADWNAEKPGSYVAEIVAGRGKEELGRDVVTFRREDGVAENFHTEQNRELLEKLAEQTGGRYYTRGERRPAGGRDLVLGSRHHDARDERPVGHADRVPAGAAAARLGVAAAAEVGCGMRA